MPLDEALIKARVRARLLGRITAVCVDRFELVRQLGLGGQGTVYEARDRQSGARLAMKQLHSAYAARGGSLTREFRALADLVHPNLVTLHELFHVAGQHFFTMDLVSGTDFIDHVRPDERGPCYVRLRAVLPQLLSGLEALHRAGKVHRDLKPSNVLVRADGRVVILDYGLVLDEAAAFEGGDVGSPTAGTPAYAAPEQVAGHAVAASDLYAVGVMLYLAITGRLPCGGSVTTLLLRKRTDRTDRAGPRPPSAFVRDVPVDLDALCVALLAHDPAERPTAALARAWCLGEAVTLQEGPYARSHRSPAPPERFVGRGTLLAELHRLADVRAATPLALLLHGESGIGKTALLRRFCAERSALGALVLKGRCYEREHVPYKALDAIVDQLVLHLNALPSSPPITLPPEQHAALTRLFPVFERLRTRPPEAPERAPLGDLGELRLRAFAAMKTLCRVLCDHREVVFAIDDLQWGDLDSTHLLQHLFGGLEAPPILIVGVTRSEEMQTNPVMQALRAIPSAGASFRCIDVAVGPLARDEAAELLSALLPADDPHASAQREVCITQAAGLPFALHQLAEHVRELGGEADAFPWLSEVVRARVSRCSPAARRLLDVLAVAGRPLETALALESASAEPTAFHAAMELCGRKLARFRDSEHVPCLEPYHDLVRTAVTQGISPTTTRAIHRDIVRVLSVRAPARPEHLVAHLLGAEDFEQAGLTALSAAERAGAQLAWSRAADLLLIAERVLSAALVRTHAVHERLATALAAADRHREAASAYAEAARYTETPRERRRLEGLSAQQRMRAGDIVQGTAQLERLLRAVGYRLPRAQSAILLHYTFSRLRKRVSEWLAGVARTEVRSERSEERMQMLALAYSELWVREPLRASLIHTWLYHESLRVRDRYWLGALAAEVAVLTATYGPAGERRVARLLEAAEAVRDKACSPYEHAVCHLAQAMYALHSRWCPEEALIELEAADALFAQHCPGSFYERSWTAALRDFSLELAGDYVTLRASIAEREQHARERDDGYSQGRLLMTVPLVHMLCDRPEAAMRYLHTHWSRPRTLTFVDYEVIVRRSNILLYQGDAERAHACLMDEWGALRRSGLLAFHVVRENASYHRARNAAALYWSTRAPKLAREVRRRVARARRAPPVLRAFYRLLEASLAWADADHVGCRAALCAANADAATHGASAIAWGARYRLAQLDGEVEAIQTARAWFSARGVRDPERWISLWMPGPSSPAPASRTHDDGRLISQ